MLRPLRQRWYSHLGSSSRRQVVWMVVSILSVGMIGAIREGLFSGGEADGISKVLRLVCVGLKVWSIFEWQAVVGL